MARAQGKGYAKFTLSQEANTLLGLSPAAKLAIDIGGNVGHYSQALRSSNTNLELHIFEPAATNVAKLHEQFKTDSRTTIVSAALAETTGIAQLYSDQSGSGLASLTKRDLGHVGITFDTQESVQTIRFEDYWRDTLEGRIIDAVKVDVEGHELSVLKSFGLALDATRAIQFEFGGTNIDTRVFLRDIWNFLTPHQFDIFRLTPWGLHKIDRYSEREENFSFTNFYAVNRTI